jgi:hypothetical protein
LKSKRTLEIQAKVNQEYIFKTKDNAIIKNLIEFQKLLIMPTETELIDEAKRLIKIGWKNKKNKKLIFEKDYNKLKDYKKKDFIKVEDSLLVYKYNYLYTSFKIPTISFGGRIHDSLNCLPSWIRNLIKINNQAYKELDFSCLHPNIANKLYGKNDGTITHKAIAEATGKNIAKVKIQHLSFFNKTIEANLTTLDDQSMHKTMEASFLYEYYEKNYPEMLQAILKEKQESSYKKVTERIFKIETMLMTAIIEELNQSGIFVGYIFDALFCAENDAEKVTQTMNDTAKKMNLHTFAK